MYRGAYPTRTSQTGGIFNDADVSNLWSGALTDNGVTVWADLSGNVASKIVVTSYDDEAFESPVYSSTLVEPTATEKSGGGSYYSVKHTVSGLLPNTSYRFAVAPGGTIKSSGVGSFKTAPVEDSAAAFRFAFGSCCSFTGDEDSPAFNGMLADAPLFFLHLGDIVYDNYTGTDVNVKRGNVRTHLGVTDVQAFYRTCPLAYTWSDHDSAGDDQHRSSTISGTTYDDVIARARTVYEEIVPHFPLEHDATILQSWRIAKTCFIMMDTQTLRDAGTNKEVLGAEQQALIISLAEQAVADGCTLLFLISAATWTSSPYLGWQPTWNTQQTALLDALKAIPGLPRVILLSGDAHAIGADDGANTDFSTGGGMDIVQFMSSPLHQANLDGAGPFEWLSVDTENSANNRAYAVVDVSADNQDVTVTFKGRNGAGNVATIAAYSTADLA